MVGEGAGKYHVTVSSKSEWHNGLYEFYLCSKFISHFARPKGQLKTIYKKNKIKPIIQMIKSVKTNLVR